MSRMTRAFASPLSIRAIAYMRPARTVARRSLRSATTSIRSHPARAHVRSIFFAARPPTPALVST